MTKRASARHANCIRQLRMEKGFSQRELASIMGYESVSALSRLEAGTKLPSYETMVKLEAALQHPIRLIYAGSYEAIYEPVMKRRVAFANKRTKKRALRKRP